MKVYKIKTEMKLLRHEKHKSFASQEEFQTKNDSELKAYDMEYFNRVKEIMQKLQTVEEEYQVSEEQDLIRELYMRDLKSLDSARESYHDKVKFDKNQSPEIGQDFKSRTSFVLDQ